MKYSSKFKCDLDFIRRKNGWEWEYKSEKSDSSPSGEVIFFRPFKETTKQGAWFFNGNSENPDHNEYVWDQEQPWLEYTAENVEKWNKEHPNNPTRYLSSYTALGTAVASVSDVIIDTKAPIFKDWGNTEFLYVNTNKKTVELNVIEDTGIDPGCVIIKLGDDILYKQSRKESCTHETSKISKPVFFKTIANTWTIRFQLTDVSAEELNEKHLKYEIWDIAGNHTIIECTENWEDYNIDELSGVIPLVITFYDKNPKNMIVEEGNIGSVWVDIFNPNYDYRVFPITFELDERSIGAVDITTIDDSTYEQDGHIKFKVVSINDSGVVQVNAWLSTTVAKDFDNYLKEASYAEATCGPWIIEDENGRKYHFIPQMPKLIQGTNFGEFLLFVELYLNTIYCGLDNNKHISALEKISRINNFNDIARLENGYLYKFANEFGNEIDLSLQEIQDFNNSSFIRSDDENDSDTYSYKTISTTPILIEQKIADYEDYEDAITLFRNVLIALPQYNKMKGTRDGMQCMLRIFGITCSIINLWRSTDKDDTGYVQEDNLDYSELVNYFLTSRFDINISKINTDLQTFSKNVETLKKILIMIKPVNRLLNSINYSLETKTYVYLNHFIKESRIKEEDNFSYEVNYLTDSAKIHVESNLSKIIIPYNGLVTTSKNKKYNNAYFLLMKLNGQEATVKIDSNEKEYTAYTSRDYVTLELKDAKYDASVENNNYEKLNVEITNNKYIVSIS